MEPTPGRPGVGEAVAELHQYLSDTVAPLVVADAVRMLIEQPPELTAGGIGSWLTEQVRAEGGRAPISDYLYHAVRKLQVIGELTLIPRDRTAEFLERLRPHLVALCPEPDREALVGSLVSLARAGTSSSSAVPVLHRQGPGGIADGPTIHLRVLEGLLRRVERLPVGRESEAERRAAVSGVAAAFAGRARDPGEMRRFLKLLGRRGSEPVPGDVLRTLGGALPAWLPTAGAATVSGAVQAMERVVTSADDQAELIRRYQALVSVGVEQLNGGELARAVATFDLASRLVEEQRVDRGAAAVVRERAEATVDEQRLLRLTEDRGAREGLRRILDFFDAYGSGSLLAALQHEERRERRRLQLALLEVHGGRCRAEVVARLADSVGSFGDRDAYFQRNLLHLLRVVPPLEGEVGEAEVELAAGLSAPGHPLALVKEALSFLGERGGARGERTLLRRLAELERQATQPTGYSATEVHLLLDRVTHGLARQGTPIAVAAVVEHGLASGSRFGNSLKRLESLAPVDLSGEQVVVERLLRALAGELPRRVLGVRLGRPAPRARHLLVALSSTRSPAVIATLADIVARHPGSEVAEHAARLQARLSAPVEAPATSRAMTGDLDLFGLPALLQNLAQAEATGLLTLRDAGGAEIGTVRLVSGGLVESRCGSLTGDEAFFTIIERPGMTSFGFVSPDGPRPHAERPSRDLTSMLFEAMRRYDELQRARLLVPDGALLRPTGARPTRPAAESDDAFLRLLWSQLKRGTTAGECERAIEAEPYRVRRALAQWVEEGSLETA